MTRLLKPLFHNPSALLIPSAMTPPPSVSSDSCSPALPLFTQHAPVDCSEDEHPPCILVPEPTSPQPKVLEGCSRREEVEFDPLQCSRTFTSYNPPIPHQTSHCSAPPSLNSSPHEHTVMPHPYSSSSIPSLSSSSHLSSITPLLVDISGPGSEPQTQSHPQSRLTLLSQSESQLLSQQQVPPCFQLQSQLMSQSYPHSLSQPHLQPLLQPSSMAPHSREPLMNLQEEVEWGEPTDQLSFINEGPV